MPGDASCRGVCGRRVAPWCAFRETLGASVHYREREKSGVCCMNPGRSFRLRGFGGVTDEGLDGWQGLNRLSGLLSREADFVEALQVEPELGAGAEEVGEAESCVAGDGAAAVEDLGDAVGGHSDLAREFSRADAEFI